MFSSRSTLDSRLALASNAVIPLGFDSRAFVADIVGMAHPEAVTGHASVVTIVPQVAIAFRHGMLSTRSPHCLLRRPAAPELPLEGGETMRTAWKNRSHSMACIDIHFGERLVEM